MSNYLSLRVATRIAAAVILTVVFSSCSNAETVDRRIFSAAESFREIMNVPEKGIPRDLLDRPECVVFISICVGPSQVF